MRNIIFRGKRLDGKGWVESMTIAYGDIRRKKGIELLDIIKNEWVDVDPATVGQYTGMKDKNGKKIFEGDIMSLVTEFGDTIIREIQFIDGTFCVIGEREDDLYGLSWAIEKCDGIVGDNIHDNPDLLK